MSKYCWNLQSLLSIFTKNMTTLILKLSFLSKLSAVSLVYHEKNENVSFLICVLNSYISAQKQESGRLSTSYYLVLRWDFCLDFTNWQKTTHV